MTLAEMALILEKFSSIYYYLLLILFNYGMIVKTRRNTYLINRLFVYIYIYLSIIVIKMSTFLHFPEKTARFDVKLSLNHNFIREDTFV